MPQLPSGRHVAIKPLTLDTLCRSAATDWGATTKLVQIEKIPDLYAYLDVLYFRDENDPATPGDVHEDMGGTGLPAGLVPYRSGLTVAMALAGEAGWSRADLDSFRAFLDLSRMQGFFNQLLEHVQKVKLDISRHGDFLTRYVTTLWIAGLHPLQPGNEPWE